MTDGVREDQVLPYGMPRTDCYAGKKKGDGGTFLAGKRAYLYAPTYRSAEDGPLPELDLEWLDGELSDGEMIVVKAHTMTGKILKGSFRHIVEIDPEEPTAPYLYDCDVVITDFSSIMFDAYLLGKPVVLFEKRKGYLKTRGMYFDYPGGYSSRYCTDEHDLPDALRDATDLGRVERECIRKVAGACDGHSSRRVCELIRSLE
jgi:CDP-ribitol ribitolphosphotransferase